VKNASTANAVAVLSLWLQLSSFGKAFSRKKKAGSMSDADSDVSSLYADAALSVTGNSPPHSWTVMPLSPGRELCADAAV